MALERLEDIIEDDFSWSVSNPASSIDLLQLDYLDTAGDLLFIEENGRVYVKAGNDLVLIKEKWTDDISSNPNFIF